MSVVCLRFEGAASLEPIAEACLRLSPKVAIGEQSIFLDLGRNARVPEARLKALLSRFALRGAWSSAEDAPTALARAWFGEPPFPIDALRAYAFPFGAPWEERCKVQDLILNLRRLGIYKVDQFLKLPADGRLGDWALRLPSLIRAPYLMPWPKHIQAEVISEHESFEPIESIDSLLFLYKRALDRFCARLRGRGLRALSLDLRLHQEKHSAVAQPLRRLTVTFHQPQGSVASILRILRERLHAEVHARPFESAVIRFEIELNDSAPGIGAQRHFFDRREEEREEMDSLLGRLSEKLGSVNVFWAKHFASYRPEGNWKRQFGEPEQVEWVVPQSNASGIPERPLRLLPDPEPIATGPGNISIRGHSYPVNAWKGPERICGEWWADADAASGRSGFKRDYFRVLTQDERVFWIYKDLRNGGFFLHGVFD